MPEAQHLRVEVVDAIATLTIDRPERLNALSRATFDALESALRELTGNRGIRGIIITGAGPKAFVAGADIGELASMTPLEAIEISRRGQQLFREIELSRKPVVAAVNGFAMGGGCELALACHLRIASTNAKFALPEVKLGILPGYGGTIRLPRLVGLGRALEMLLTGEAIGAEEAHRIGLVNRVVEPEQLLDESRRLLEVILKNGPVAVGLAIQSAVFGLDGAIEQGLAIESNLFGLLAASDDMREGMTAFLEKRKAEFEGR